MQRSEIASPADDEGSLEFGTLRIMLDGYAVSVGGRDVRVTYSEFLLLKTLALQPFRVFDRAALQHAISASACGGNGPSPDIRLIDRHVARLRKKLRDAGYGCIQTMRFAGYRFVPHHAGREADAPPEDRAYTRLAG